MVVVVSAEVVSALAVPLTARVPALPAFAFAFSSVTSALSVIVVVVVVLVVVLRFARLALGLPLRCSSCDREWSGEPEAAFWERVRMATGCAAMRSGVWRCEMGQ